MIEFHLISREIGRLKPDFSLLMQAPAVPREGDYISVSRPDNVGPYGEDFIVRKVWWRFTHPETAGYGTGPEKKGSLNELFVECDPAVGPWSGAQWRKYHQRPDVHEMEVARIDVGEERLKK